jgi:hypothetical protein
MARWLHPAGYPGLSTSGVPAPFFSPCKKHIIMELFCFNLVLPTPRTTCRTSAVRLSNQPSILLNPASPRRTRLIELYRSTPACDATTSSSGISVSRCCRLDATQAFRCGFRFPRSDPSRCGSGRDGWPFARTFFCAFPCCSSFVPCSFPKRDGSQPPYTFLLPPPSAPQVCSLPGWFGR